MIKNLQLVRVGLVAVLGIVGVPVRVCAAGDVPVPPPPPVATFSQLDDPWLGKPVYVVDRLDDYAAGEDVIPHTLRWATEQLESGGGIVVFRRSGTIVLTRKLRIGSQAHDWLIAGYTAPSPGILVVHHGWDVAGQNWSIEHLRIRPGAVAYDDHNGDQNDALGITGRREVTLSTDPEFQAREAIRNGRVVNCSLSWASDELVQLFFPPIIDIDFVDCIFTEALHDPDLHPKPEIHGFGPLVGADVGPVGFQRCLFANNLRRNPRINDGSPVFFADNVLLNPGGAGVELRVANQWRPDGTPKTARLAHEGPFNRPHQVTVTGNLYIAGPDTRSTTRLVTQGERPMPGSEIYVRGNVRWDAASASWQALDEGAAWEIEKGAAFTAWSAMMPLVPQGYLPMSPAEVEAELLANAGAFPQARDVVDLRVMEQLAQRTGGRIQRQSDAGLDHRGRPHDADGYELLPENRWPDGRDPALAWALPAETLDTAAVRSWLAAKRALLLP